ncbi:hypothetical protein Pfo_005238 [Paulownia fortunei]|nr:hypothetical protein Pfo_005238 [Paulownia fortunei]
MNFQNIVNPLIEWSKYTSLDLHRKIEKSEIELSNFLECDVMINNLHYSTLPSAWLEACALDAEIIKYISEAYPKGVCSVYCANGKDVEEPGSDFELVVVISAARHSPQNFCNGSWRSIWNMEFKDELQIVEVRGKLQVGAHYFEEGNVQLDAKHECKDSTIFQSPDDCAASLTTIIRHHEMEYLNSLQMSYSNLPDTTFKDLRRKLPVTRTLFPWHNTLQFSLTRDIQKNLGLESSK